MNFLNNILFLIFILFILPFGCGEECPKSLSSDINALDDDFKVIKSYILEDNKAKKSLLISLKEADIIIEKSSDAKMKCERLEKHKQFSGCLLNENKFFDYDLMINSCKNLKSLVKSVEKFINALP